MKMKYGFYVSGNASRLKYYLQSQAFKSSKKHDVSFILSDNKNDEELRTLCQQLSISVYQYSYKELELKGKEQNKFISEKFLELLNSTSSDYAFVFGGRILEGELLVKYYNKLINFHPAILPAYKGIAAIDQALQGGAILLGNTAHFINEELDAGPFIMQSIIPAHQFQDYDQILNLQIPMIYQIAEWLSDNRISVTDNKVCVEGASYKLDTFIPNLEQ